MQSERKLHLLASVLFFLATFQVVGMVWTAQAISTFQRLSIGSHNTAFVAHTALAYTASLSSDSSAATTLEQKAEVVLHFFENGTETPIASFVVSYSDHPEWFDETTGGLSADLERHVTLYVEDHVRDMLPSPVDAIVRSVSNDGVERASILGMPKDGYVTDTGKLSAQIANAVRNNQRRIDVQVQAVEGRLYMAKGTQRTWMTKLSTGRSDYAKSPLGRIANVQKAITEKVHGVVVPAGATFSFNAAMGDAIDGRNGWSNSLVIVNGKDLVEAPGGGICQAATTTLRAVALAGLPIEKRANHSLFVGYYEENGVGLDAAVFPKKQDFTFVNDMEQDIVLIGRTEGTLAFVDVYGTSDGRKVTLQGPHFANGSPFSGKSTPLQRNEIGWTQSVRYADGTQREDSFVSRYVSIPKRLTSQFIAAKTITKPDEL